MNTIAITAILTFPFLSACLPLCTQEQPISRVLVNAHYPVIEKYPNDAKKITVRYEELLKPAKKRVSRVVGPRINPAAYVMTTVRKWPSGHTLTVAFLGGSQELHEKIIAAATVWTSIKGKDGKSPSINLDFGMLPNYRTWSRDDSDYSADIRIAFEPSDTDSSGYWSDVGQNSRDRTIHGPGQPSMMFDGFAQGLPYDWKSTIMHEFGHAFGFQHEHQTPKCKCDFRWTDDFGYQKTQDPGTGSFITDRRGRNPGIRTMLKGPLNSWDDDKIDDNLKNLPESSAFSSSQFDTDSIMKYNFPAIFYVHGENSVCFRRSSSEELSELDKQGFLLHYPSSKEDIETEKQRELAVLQIAYDALNAKDPAVGDAASLQTHLRERIAAKISQLN